MMASTMVRLLRMKQDDVLYIIIIIIDDERYRGSRRIFLLPTVTVFMTF